MLLGHSCAFSALSVLTLPYTDFPQASKMLGYSGWGASRSPEGLHPASVFFYSWAVAWILHTTSE